MPVTRKMHLVAYLKTGPTASYASAWRHPSAPLHDIWDAERYEHLARLLEHARFDAGFFADGLGLPDLYKNSFADYVGRGGQLSLIDPMTVLPLMARVTRHLGLGNTISTTFNQPYQIARSLGSLDLLSRGRAAWNVVTSATDYEARNCGMDGVPPQDDRYDRADDVLEAGSSPRGRECAARWADMIFCTTATKADGIEFRADMHRRLRAAGRCPTDVAVLPTLSVVIGETESIAREKAEFLDSLIDPELVMASSSTLLGVDLSAIKTAEEAEVAARNQGISGSLHRLSQRATAQHLTSPTHF